MRFSEYQLKAELTDQSPIQKHDSDIGLSESIIIPLLGLAGESGGLLTEYKKYLRDGDSYPVFSKRIKEELGDVLWYISNIASKSGLSLEDIAKENLSKISDRWRIQLSPLFGPKFYDEDYKELEQFPRQFEVTVKTIVDVDGKERVELLLDGEPLGSPLRDNAYEDDGYRYHDVFHLSYLAVLGWSPVMRKLMGRKRISVSTVDENEDGGRASVIDEAISAFVFSEAGKNKFFENVQSIDYSIIRMIKELTAHLEVRSCSGKQWEDAILAGFAVWRELKKTKNGTIVCNLHKQSITFTPKN
jgi:NTP pyrophosphatase (non-canonical NTP hydrolase)